MRNWDEDEDFDRGLNYAEMIEDDVDEDSETFGCNFPGRCLMPGLHFPSECHTFDMIEVMEKTQGAMQ